MVGFTGPQYKGVDRKLLWDGLMASYLSFSTTLFLWDSQNIIAVRSIVSAPENQLFERSVQKTDSGKMKLLSS
jgi:hypothetical protein